MQPYQLDINKIFSFHPATDPKVKELHEFVREGARLLATDWNNYLPASPEKTLAIRRLQEAMMYANSAIAQNSDKS